MWAGIYEKSSGFLDGSLTATYDGDGVHVGYSKVMLDIRPNRLFGKMLKTILDGMPDVIFAIDSKG